MILRTEFLSGLFGDPALYVWELNAKKALLIDCGDLSHFSTRQLLKVSHIFLSHCHIDHFYGFDHFLRVHVGSEKTVTVMGPPQTSARVAGKLQGYTWNLISDQNLEFVAVDLDTTKRQKETTHFRARDRFCPTGRRVEAWDPEDQIYDAGTFKVTSVTLDHRTPSMAYALEEKVTVAINSENLRKMGFKTGPWLNALKEGFLTGRLEKEIEAAMTGGTFKVFTVGDLAKSLLVPRQRHKIVYATDGAASDENKKELLKLIDGADLFFAETCFLQTDKSLADETKHFTAEFIGNVAEQAHVKKIMPFHFSKRYSDRPQEVFGELSRHFNGELVGRTETPSREATV